MATTVADVLIPVSFNKASAVSGWGIACKSITLVTGAATWDLSDYFSAIYSISSVNMTTEAVTELKVTEDAGTITLAGVNVDKHLITVIGKIKKT